MSDVPGLLQDSKRPDSVISRLRTSEVETLKQTGVVDKGGSINLSLSGINPRIRDGERGTEYVIAWAGETEQGKDIAINNVDIDNLKRAKALDWKRLHELPFDARRKRMTTIHEQNDDLDPNVMQQLAWVKVAASRVDGRPSSPVTRPLEPLTPFPF